MSASVFTNLNKLYNPNATQKDKVVEITKAVTIAVTGFVPNPIIGSAVQLKKFPHSKKTTQIPNFYTHF
jgi:hypothetical protein